MNSKRPYVQIEDGYGAVASVYILPDNKHVVKYGDDAGRMFYTEVFDQVPIEFIEQSVMEWAKGKRELMV
jgi:hypothetical protein